MSPREVTAKPHIPFMELNQGPRIKVFVGDYRMYFPIPLKRLNYHRDNTESSVVEGFSESIHLEDEESQNFAALVQWMYTGRLSILDDHLEEGKIAIIHGGTLVSFCLDLVPPSLRQQRLHILGIEKKIIAEFNWAISECFIKPDVVVFMSNMAYENASFHKNLVDALATYVVKSPGIPAKCSSACFECLTAIQGFAVAVFAEMREA